MTLIHCVTMTDLLLAAEGVELRGLRREEYERLAELGVFEGEQVELVGGEIVRVSPQLEPHSWAVMRLTAQLAPLMIAGYDVRVQLPLAVDEYSLPEPDVAITRGQRSPDDRPTTALVVIEVAATSQRMDLVHKAPRYAAAGVETYVVLDLAQRVAVVHTDPRDGRYQHLRRVAPGEDMLVLDASVDLTELLGT